MEGDRFVCRFRNKQRERVGNGSADYHYSEAQIGKDADCVLIRPDTEAF